jgi:hypothetical protein
MVYHIAVSSDLSELNLFRRCRRFFVSTNREKLAAGLTSSTNRLAHETIELTP